jgi:hypothetical protein
VDQNPLGARNACAGMCRRGGGMYLPREGDTHRALIRKVTSGRGPGRGEGTRTKSSHVCYLVSMASHFTATRDLPFLRKDITLQQRL